MLANKNCLILTSDSGFGHRSTALASEKAMMAQHPQDSISGIVNPLDEESASLLLKKNGTKS